MDSIRKTDEEERLIEICEKELGIFGFRVVDLDCYVSSRSLIRIFVEPVDGRTSIQDCEKLSRRLEPIIEGASPHLERYDLEVSSPGLDKRLRLLKDFEAVVGEEVELKLIEKVEGWGANIKARLCKVVRTEMGAGLLLMQGQVEGYFELCKIKKAKLVWNYNLN